jgi:hypothetical protein
VEHQKVIDSREPSSSTFSTFSTFSTAAYNPSSQQDKVFYWSFKAFDLISSKTINIIVTYTEFRKEPGQRQQQQRPKGEKQQQPSW